MRKDKFGSVKIINRISLHPIDEVLTKVSKNNLEDDVELSDRLLCFLSNGIECAGCGVRGEIFALEETEASCGERKTYNLYANNFKTYFTKDHIIPKSKGGQDTIDNYQTMCWECNSHKGNKMS